MLYFKVNNASYFIKKDKTKYHLGKDELYTKKEYNNLLNNAIINIANRFTPIEISKNKTFYLFGYRFEKEF